jgi:hypothetical protein
MLVWHVIDVVSLILLSKRIITVLGGVSPFFYADVLMFLIDGWRCFRSFSDTRRWNY